MCAAAEAGPVAVPPSDAEHYDVPLLGGGGPCCAAGGAEAAGPRHEAEGLLSLPRSAIWVLTIELCERISWYGVGVLLFGYMRHMLGWTEGAASGAINAFMAWAWLSAIPGGVIADQYWGKVRTIGAGSSVYMVGLLVLVATALPCSWSHYPDDPAGGFVRPGLIAALFVIGLGTGMIKANVTTLVADQLGDCPSDQKASTFRWLFWFINVGSLVSQLVTPLLHQHRLLDKDAARGSFAGSDEADQGTSYWLAFSFPLLAFCMAIGVFAPLACQGAFIDREPEGSLLRDCWQAGRAALRARRAARAAGDVSQRAHWLDWAAGSQRHAANAADLKRALRACRVFVFFPVYHLTYNQLQTNFIAQAGWLDKPQWLSSEALNVLEPLTLTIFVPIFDYVVFPWLRRRGCDPNAIQRMTIGFVLAAMCIVWALAIQVVVARRGTFTSDDYHPDAGVARVSVWWQAPAYPIFAFSEIFTTVSGLEFAYAEAPPRLKSIVMALFLITFAAGGLMGVAMTPAVKPANLVCIFAGFSGVQFVFTLIFHRCFRNYRMKDMESPASQNDAPSTGCSSLGDRSNAVQAP